MIIVAPHFISWFSCVSGSDFGDSEFGDSISYSRINTDTSVSTIHSFYCSRSRTTKRVKTKSTIGKYYGSNKKYDYNI